jgi:hypothetical protein
LKKSHVFILFPLSWNPFLAGTIVGSQHMLGTLRSGFVIFCQEIL